MKSINKIIDNKEQDISIKQNYIKALEDSKFKSLISMLKLREDLAMKYTTRLMDCAVEVDNCKNCSSLSSCKNSVKGYCLFAKENGNVINFSYNMCRYLSKEEYRDNVKRFDVPKEIREASMKNIYTNDKNRIEIIKALKTFISDYNAGKKTKGIYLHGSFGCGKTYLISALFNEFAKKNITSVIVHTPELLRSLKDSFSSDYSEKFYLLKNTPLLLLDDIGAEYLTSWGRDEVIEPILQYRMDQGLPTFFTSNFTVSELEKHFATTSNNIDKVKARRIIERIKQLSIEVELVSKNLR